MKNFVVALAIAISMAVAVFAGCPSVTTADSKFQLANYLGRWYEIGTNAKFRSGFEKGLVCTTATYSMEDSSTVKVDNAGRKMNPTNGTIDKAIGKAKVVEGAKLKVSFFGPFYGPYWVIDLVGNAATNYSVSLVYSCSFDELVEDLWVLSRTPQLPKNVTFQGMLSVAQNMGINVPSLDMSETYQGSDCVYGY